MSEICVPIPKFKENQVAEVHVKIEGKTQRFDFRLESFPWIGEKGSERVVNESDILKLKNYIESYPEGWELVQILTPKVNSEFIQVLFRKREST
jgi:hypothetical protein